MAHHTFMGTTCPFLNTQSPESTFKKNSKSICYHAIHDSIVMGESLTGNLDTKNNCSVLATKILSGRKRKFNVLFLLYEIYDYL